MAITLVGQDYEFIESKNKYKIEIEITYRGREISISIRKSKDNFNKDKKLRCFNYNTYRYIAKECQKPKKERDTRKYYKYNKIGYIVKDYRSGQKVKNRSIQEESDEETNNK